MKKIVFSLLVLAIMASSFAFGEADLIKVEVNEQELIFDVEPIIKEGRPMVPVRAIFESLYLEVSWDDKSKAVTVKNKDTQINLIIGDKRASVNDKVIILDHPPLIINERTMVPVRFIGQAIGADFSWDNESRTLSIKKTVPNSQDYKTTLTYSNLLDKASQEEVRKAMEVAGFLTENIESFFADVDKFNGAVKGTSLVDKGFVTINSLEPDYDYISMMDLWDANFPEFIGYNCRIVSYDLMKDAIKIGKPNTSNSAWMVFDENALEYNPIDLFNKEEHEGFRTLYSSIPAELTKDINIHLKNVKEDWNAKQIEFLNEDKRSIISVFFHDEEGYLFIGHMGVLIPTQDGKLLFIEKLSFHQPYQAIKFDNRTELNDYLMNKYDISWGQETAKPFIMENNELLQGYREKPNNLENQLNK